MQILIFKTNISDSVQLEQIRPVLNGVSSILKWNIDQDDCDNVLRIEAENLGCKEIISLITHHGFLCEELRN